MTSLLLDAPGLTGDQAPRICSRPGTAISSAGAEVVALAKSAGLILDPWQCFILDVMLAERADGKWESREVAYLVARQNGKGGVLDALGLACLFLFDDEIEVLHTAHEFKTAKKAYRSLKSLISSTPVLYAEVERRGRRVVGFRQSNEDTSITLQNGKVIRFIARSNNSGRGFSPQRVIMDEAQELSEDARGALQYTVSAQPNPQLVYTGTVPDEKNNDEVWESLRDRGREGGDTTLAWMEYTPAKDADPDSIEAVTASNPALGYRITAESIMGDHNAARTPRAYAGYLRERLSIWWGDGAETVIDMKHWAALKVIDPPKATDVALSFDVSPARTDASVCFAGRLPDGRRLVDPIQSASGTGWVVPLIVKMRTGVRRNALVVVDAGAPGGSLIPELRKAGIDEEHGLVIIGATELARGCGMFYDGVVGTPAGGEPDDADYRPAIDPDICHADRPILNKALAGAKKRKLADAWAWARADETDITSLVGCTQALIGLERAPKKKRSGRVW